MRPHPPTEIQGGFTPAQDVEAWIRALVIDDGGALSNEDHAHLRNATIGILWTDRDNTKRGRSVLGMCQAMPPGGDKWSAARAISQIEEWFGDVPDFLITLHAPAASEMSDTAFLALVEHELYHAGQERDQYGAPKFNPVTGEPVLTLRGHDVEEFVGVVRRYGSTSPELTQMFDAVGQGPEIAASDIALACGNCLGRGG